MSVYDPLGMIAPFTIQVKLILQDIWRSGVSWESRIREEEFKTWMTWLKNLAKMHDCRIPRCYIKGKFDYANVSLHIFCDASTKAYAAAAYLKSETRDGNVHISLVFGKARVTQKKPMTIPRLELQAAVLGTKIAVVIRQELELEISERVFWSDFTTVLHWIRGEPREKQIFVANRLGHMAEVTKISEWRWVPTHLNPADDATRPSGEPMKSNDRWLMGPDFLRERPESWPKQKSLPESEKREINQLESCKLFIGTTFVDAPEKWEVSLSVRLLGWPRLRRTMEYVRRCFYIWHCEARTRNKKPWSSPHIPGLKNETALDSAMKGEETWFRVIQATYFSNEIDALSHGREIARGSKLYRLGAFLDDNGLLRVRGRFDSKITTNWLRHHPIILDASHYATKLLIAEYHRRYDHANNQTVINELGQRFYIIGLRTRLKWLANHCITCRLRRAKPVNPPMANLPACRVAHGQRPFTYCGIDYFGPMFVKIGRRREKRWGVLFTCKTTRAIHVELAQTLNASSAIMAIQRLAGRRGFPRKMFSDNGTNFIKAEKELREAVVQMSENAIEQTRFATANNFRWIFNPPDAPYMGGAWERLIRSVKTALYHVLNDQAPTEETLSTLLVEIEHMVNSRPLTHVSVDPADEEALTPNHFLIGSSSGHLRLEKYQKEIESPRKHFEIIQNMANGFWKRWSREYLPTLLPRSKWITPTDPLDVGDIVLIVDMQAPRNSWRKGKVIETFPNRSDGVV